jgi:hypothetical protein
MSRTKINFYRHQANQEQMQLRGGGGGGICCGVYTTAATTAQLHLFLVGLMPIEVNFRSRHMSFIYGCRERKLTSIGIRPTKNKCSCAVVAAVVSAAECKSSSKSHSTRSRRYRRNWDKLIFWNSIARMTEYV